MRSQFRPGPDICSAYNSTRLHIIALPRGRTSSRADDPYRVSPCRCASATVRVKLSPVTASPLICRALLSHPTAWLPDCPVSDESSAMKGYVVIDTDAIDPEANSQYVEKVLPVIAAHGGRFLVRTGDVVAVHGDWAPKRLVILEFDSLEAARGSSAPPNTRPSRTSAREGRSPGPWSWKDPLNWREPGPPWGRILTEGCHLPHTELRTLLSAQGG